MIGSFPTFLESSTATLLTSISASASNCGDSDAGLPLHACLFGESLKADEAACDTADLSLLQVRAGPARKFPGIGALARGIQIATSEVFGKGGATETEGGCGFTEAESAAEVPSGKVRSYDGEITAEGCLHWCLGETMCRSAVFEPDSSSCHVLPEFYGKGHKRMLVAGSGAVAADKICETKCKLSQPKKGKSPGSELKALSAGTMHECQAHCLKEKECLSLVFKAEDKMCFLKSQVADPDAEHAADDAEFCNKDCHDKCSFKDPVMLESFKGSAPLEHRKAVAELQACQEACQDRIECRAVLFGQDSANCYLLSASHSDEISHYFSVGDAVISKKKICGDSGETTVSVNSSDVSTNFRDDDKESEEDVDAEKMSVLSRASGSNAGFDALSEFETFENIEDTDDDLVDIVSEEDKTAEDKTSNHATTDKDVDADLSIDVASEFAERSDDVAKIMADFHVDGKDEVDADSKATKENVSDTKTGHKNKKEKQASPGTSKFDAEVAEFEDDGQDEYGAVFDALGEDDGKSRQTTKEAGSKSTASVSTKEKAEEEEVRKAREEEEKQLLASSSQSEQEEEEDEDAVEDYTDNDEDLADVFEHLEDGHASTFVDAQADPTQPESGSIDLKKLKHDESDFAKEHIAPEHQKNVADARSEIRQARKAEKSQKAHNSRKDSRKKDNEETSDLASASVISSEAGPAPTPGPLTLDSDLDSAVVASQPTMSSVAESVSEDHEESTLSSGLDPTMEAQKAALQAVLEGKTQQAQEVQQAQQVVSQQQLPLPQTAQVPQMVSTPPSEKVLQAPQQVPQQVPQLQQQEQNASQPQVQSQQQAQQSMQTAQLFSQQSDQAEADEADKPYDLSWLTDKGVDVTSEDEPSQLVPNQNAPNQDADSPPLPSLPQLPQQQVVPAPKQPSVPQHAILTTAEPQNVATQERLPTALAAEGSKVVRIDGLDGPSVLLGGHAFNGAPATTGVGDAPPVMDLSLIEGSGFSLAFTIDWQEFSPGVHAIDIGDKESDSDILSVSSAEDGSALSFAMMHKGIPSVLTVSHAFEVGVSARFLCTVGSTGKMQAFRDGTILGRLKPDGTYQDNSPGGSTNPALANGQLFLGRSTEEQRNSAAKTFTGWLGDVCVFPKEVLWGEATSCVAKATAASA